MSILARCQGAKPNAHTLRGGTNISNNSLPAKVSNLRFYPSRIPYIYYQSHACQGCVGHMCQQHSPLAPHASNGGTTTLGAVLGDWCKLVLALTMMPQGKIHPQCVVGAMRSSISCGFGQPRNKAHAGQCSF